MSSAYVCWRRARWSEALAALAAAAWLCPFSAPAQNQAGDTEVVHVDLPVGRSYLIRSPEVITRVSVANPDVADVVVMSTHDVVVNGRAGGETDVVVWESDINRQHYRMMVHAPSDQQQIVLSVKFAEVRRQLLEQLGLSGLYKTSHVRAGTGVFNNVDPATIRPAPGGSAIPSPANFGTLLTNFGTTDLLALLQAEEQRGDVHILAEPKVMAENNDTASFLAGGEIPIPIAQPSATGVPTVTIQWKEFGIKLTFTPQIVSDTLLRIKIRPEFSQLDFTNAIVLAGFTIPALTTRRVESTVDVRRDQSLLISGLLDDERQRTRTGVPILMHVPILGALFQSYNYQRNATELLVIVTPMVVDPLHPRAQDIVPLKPDTTLPARGAIERDLPNTPLPTAAPSRH
jgi:Flp pilus assembly secretin CpaC